MYPTQPGRYAYAYAYAHAYVGGSFGRSVLGLGLETDLSRMLMLNYAGGSDGQGLDWTGD